VADVDAHGLRVDRERVVRTLTFLPRPEFVLRVVNRFQKVAGFDRAIALVASALLATCCHWRCSSCSRWQPGS
jgi:membrane protein